MRRPGGAAYKRAVTELAVVCDFDGTATLLDLGDEISRHFCGSEYLALQKKLFLEGKLDTRSIIQSIYTPIRAGEAEVVAFALQAAKLRPGFPELIAAARDRGAPFYLASGGLRQYVEAVIAAHLAPALRGYVQVRANEAVFSPGGLRVEFPGDAQSRALGCKVCGSCKRVAIATVLAMQPEILALDEPSSNLDPRNRRHLIEVIGGLPATLLLSTHDLEMALALCSRAVLMDRGKIWADGDTRQLFSNRALMKEHGLEVPLSLRLANPQAPEKDVSL